MCFCRCRSEEHTSELQSRQYLHSFPTRRSSDLDHRLKSLARLAGGEAHHDSVDNHVVERREVEVEAHPQLDERREPAVAPDVSVAGIDACHALQQCAFAAADRKSTRLNSSHANIYTLSLHDALPISITVSNRLRASRGERPIMIPLITTLSSAGRSRLKPTPSSMNVESRPWHQMSPSQA